MRYKDSSKRTIGNKRTLKSLRGALTELLKVKAIEQISVQELCKKAMISRGSFYNYFYDKYDLLNYDWEQIQLEIYPKFTDDNLQDIDYKEYMSLVFKNLINYLSDERESYQMIIKHNNDSLFFINMHEYMGEQIFLKLKEVVEFESESKVPLDLLANIYANTIITIGKWWLKTDQDYSKDDVYSFFTMLMDKKLLG